MKNDVRLVSIAMFLSTAVCSAVTNWDLQQVGPDGYPVAGCYAYDYDTAVIEGIILNRPEYMLNGTPNYNTFPWNLGGEWQIFVQGDTGDHAGTAVWIAQNYTNMTGMGYGRYTNEEWLAEIDRLNNDPCTGHRFMPGDKVRVTGLLMPHGGKANINEQHDTDPDNNIKIELVELGAGLPEPEEIPLSLIKDASNNFIFDYTRATGCEYYQSRLVRINNVHFVDANLWAPGAKTMQISDGTRTLPLWLGIGPGIKTGSNNLPVNFDVIGIFNQEDSDTGGYLLWVTNYDGNGQVLTDGCDLSGVFAAGDINKDCTVNFEDFAIMAADWLKCSNPLLTHCQ